MTRFALARRLSIAAIFVVATAGIAAGCATTNGVYEYGYGDEDVYDAWDEDDDGYLDEEEFNENIGWFETYDDDDDGLLDEDEFEAVSEDFDGISEFDDYDMDDDDELGEGEFNTGLFNDLDDDDDGRIDEDEWGI